MRIPVATAVGVVDVETCILDIEHGAALPNAGECAGVVITGSRDGNGRPPVGFSFTQNIVPAKRGSLVIGLVLSMKWVAIGMPVTRRSESPVWRPLSP